MNGFSFLQMGFFTIEMGLYKFLKLVGITFVYGRTIVGL